MEHADKAMQSQSQSHRITSHSITFNRMRGVWESGEAIKLCEYLYMMHPTGSKKRKGRQEPNSVLISLQETRPHHKPFPFTSEDDDLHLSHLVSACGWGK